MKITFFTSLLLVFMFSFAQKSKLIGYVTEQNTGMKIPGAMVKSFGANPIESSKSGHFILSFQDFPAGKNIIVRVEKEGWDLVNEKEMNTLIPENPDEKPFKIILCRAGLLAKAKSQYYQSFELNLQKELAKQKVLNTGNVKIIATLEADYARLQKQLDDLADEYSRIDLSTASARDLEAIELFEAGKYDEFIQLKNGIVTESQVDKAVQNKKDAIKTLGSTDSTIALYFKSQKDIEKALELKFQFHEAEKIFENLVSKDSNDFDNTFALGVFLQRQNQVDKAIKNYQRALKLAPSEIKVANVQNNLGMLFNEKNDFSGALDAFEKAIEIQGRLAKNNLSMYEPDLASTLNNLGVLYINKKNYPEASRALGKALEIRNRLVKNKPDIYESELAETQNNLGILYHDKNHFTTGFTDAVHTFGKALEIYERLAKNNPAIYEPHIADTQNNLGVLYQDKKDYPAALKAFGKSLEIYKSLAKNNPGAYESFVAIAQNNIGLLYKHEKDSISSLNAFEYALEIWERLAKNNPETYEPEVAETQKNIGDLFNDNKNYDLALDAFKKALKIYERLSINNPIIYEPKMAVVQNNLGDLYQDKNEYPEALKSFQKVLEVDERLAKTNPDIYEPELAKSLNILGNFYLDNNDYAPALVAFGKAFKIYKSLSKNNPASFEPDLAMTLINFGEFYELKNDYPAALENFGKAYQIYKHLAKNKPIYENDLASILSRLGYVYYNKNDFPAALNAYNKSLKIFERLAEVNPELFDIQFCHCILLLGLLQKADFHNDRQKEIEKKIHYAKQILLKYTTVPNGRSTLAYLSELEIYFDNQKNILGH